MRALQAIVGCEVLVLALDIHDGDGALLRRMPLRLGTQRLLVEVP